MNKRKDNMLHRTKCGEMVLDTQIIRYAVTGHNITVAGQATAMTHSINWPYND
jgi:hypothetical protein